MSNKLRTFSSKLLVMCMLTLTFVTAVSASAMEPEDETVNALAGWSDEVAYKKYNISGEDGQETGYLNNRIKNDCYFWVWAKEPSGRDKIVHKTHLRNSDGFKRSDWLLTYEGTTNQAATVAKYIHDYKMYIIRENTDDQFVTVSGTWGYNQN